MSALQRALVFLTLCLLLIVSKTCAEPDPAPALLLTTLTSNVPQNLEGVLGSIEERLRALDSLYALRFAAPRWEITADIHNRKLESLEAKLARIETLLEVRVDKLTENLSAKNMKEELSKEQLSRKIDVIYERLNHRMSYMESRIENNIAKFQTSLDGTLTRTSNQLEQLEKTGNDMENDIMEVSTAVEESKAVLLLLNSSNSADINSLQHVANLTTQMMTSCEHSGVLSKAVEDMTRKSLDLVNATRRELQEAIKAVKASASRRQTCPSIPDSTMDYLIEKVESMSRKNEGNYQKIDTTIERLHMRQELYQESCHRLQLKEPQIENRIAEILEKMLDSLENRTYTTDKSYETLLEKLKSHHNYVIRTVGHTTNTVMKLSEQMTQHVKSLYNNHPATDKIDSIIFSLQELQDQFHELNMTITTANHLTPYQSQILLNNTAYILQTIQNLNDNMTTIIDKLSDYHRTLADVNYEEELTDAGQTILQIFNMTEADLARVNAGDQLVPVQVQADKGPATDTRGNNTNDPNVDKGNE